jgi:uncharacterized membrane protein
MILWTTIPETVAANYDNDGHAIAFAHKSILLIISIGVTVISLMSYFIIQNLYKIDPKPSTKKVAIRYHKFADTFSILSVALNLFIIIASISKFDILDYTIVPVAGLMFAFFGNNMYHFKYNFFAGIKVPWTLKSHNNWRKTHRFAGRLWFITGLVLTVSTLPLFKHGLYVHFILFAGGFALVNMLPISYSFLLYREEEIALR